MVEEEKNKEKVEIEDILGEDDLDIEEVVSEKEKQEHPVLEETDEKVEEVIDELADTGKKDALEEAVEEANIEKKEVEEKPKKKKTKSDKKWLKMSGLVGLVALATAAIIFGVMYFMDQQEKVEEPVQEETVAEPEENTEEVVEDNSVYISSEVGLNMREEPNTDSKVVAIIPYATKIPVLSEKAGWIETEYQNEKGWVSSEYTSKENPSVYENTTYGFGFEFKPSWAGYKFFEAKNTGSTTAVTYYVALPTTDTSWLEPGGVPAGYASLFVMGVYTKAEWAKLEGEEMKPAKLGESEKYVYTYLPGQAHPKDMGTQYNEISDIIETFEVLK